MSQRQDSPINSCFEFLGQIINCGIILLDTQNQPKLINRSACDLLGCSTEDDLKHRWKSISPLLWPDSNLSPMLKPRLLRIDLPVKGSLHCLRVAIYSRENNKCSDHWVFLKNRLMLDTLDTHLLMASQMYTQTFLHGALAHALRSPLNAMQMTLELLSEISKDSVLDLDRSSQNHSIAVMKKELTHTNQTLKTVLNHDLLLSPIRQMFDVCVLMEEIVSLLKIQASHSLLDVQLHLPDHEIKMIGHQGWLKQALLNITINRLETLPKGGCLEIDVKLVQSTIRIVINDQGASLSDTQLENIYAVVFTALANPKEVGLYVARILVEVLGGNIQIENLTNKGNCFTLSLPLVHNCSAGETSLASSQGSIS